MYTTYALHNKSRDKIYIGYTKNLKRRLDRHNGKLPAKKTAYTHKNSGEWKIIHTEKFKSSTEAISREKQLKSHRGREFIRHLIENS